MGSALVEGGLDCVAALPEGAVLCRYRVNPLPPVVWWISTNPSTLAEVHLAWRAPSFIRLRDSPSGTSRFLAEEGRVKDTHVARLQVPF